MGPKYRIDLDRSVCQGHGVCVIHASALFDIADDEFGIALQDVIASDSPDLDDARAAAQKCPERAIELIEID